MTRICTSIASLGAAVLLLGGSAGAAFGAPQGPTLEETAQWLQARTDGAFVTNAERLTSWYPRLVIGKLAVSDDGETTWRLNKCYIYEWNDLRSISVIGSRLGFSGVGKMGNDAAECKAASKVVAGHEIKITIENLSGGVSLKSSAPAEQIANAIRRMAELHGSKLVADDLFK